MNAPSKPDRELEGRLAGTLFDVLIRFALALVLAFLCYEVFAPFLSLMVWAVILAVTLYPARILGVDARLGSLEPGKDADLIVTTGDPLETLTDVVYMFIHGRAVSLETKHTKLYERFK